MSHTIENKSPQFKRALQAILYALKISDEIESVEEKELLDELFDDSSFAKSAERLYYEIYDKFDDYEDYSQINDGFATGIWIELHEKENGERFWSYHIGHEFDQPQRNSEFMNTNDNEAYSAIATIKFFVPLSIDKDVEIDSTENHVVDPKSISKDGENSELGSRVATLGVNLLQSYIGCDNTKNKRPVA